MWLGQGWRLPVVSAQPFPEHPEGEILFPAAWLGPDLRPRQGPDLTAAGQDCQGPAERRRRAAPSLPQLWLSGGLVSTGDTRQAQKVRSVNNVIGNLKKLTCHPQKQLCPRFVSVRRVRCCSEQGGAAALQVRLSSDHVTLIPASPYGRESSRGLNNGLWSML